MIDFLLLVLACFIGATISECLIVYASYRIIQRIMLNEQPTPPIVNITPEAAAMLLTQHAHGAGHSHEHILFDSQGPLEEREVTFEQPT